MHEAEDDVEIPAAADVDGEGEDDATDHDGWAMVAVATVAAEQVEDDAEEGGETFGSHGCMRHARIHP